MNQHRAVTKATATRYRSSSKTVKAVILDELCALTGWHRDHARKALRAALGPRSTRRARRVRMPVCAEDVLVALRKMWAVMDAPAGKRMAPFLAEIVERLRACGELGIDDATAASLVGMSAATIDRRLAPDRAKLALKGRSGTKPGSLLKSQIPIRTWADWNDAAPGFVEIDLVGHECGNPRGDFCQTLDVTDIATGWTEPRAVQNKAQRWVFAALMEISSAFPFRSKGSTRTTAASSSTRTCWSTARKTRSRSPGPGPGTRTTVRTWSRRTGLSYARQWATTATTPQPSWRC